MLAQMTGSLIGPGFQADSCSAGQCVAAIRERLGQAVGDEAVQGAFTLDRLGPCLVEFFLLHWAVCMPQHGEQASPALPVSAVVAVPTAAQRMGGSGKVCEPP